jgi:hypothetical protein
VQACGANPDHDVNDDKWPETVGEASGCWADVGRTEVGAGAAGLASSNRCIGNDDEYKEKKYDSVADRWTAHICATKFAGSERRDIVIDTQAQQHYRACLEHAYRVVESTPFLRRTIASPPPCKSASIGSQLYDDTDFTDEEMEERFETLKNDSWSQCSSGEDKSLSARIPALNIEEMVGPKILAADRCSHVTKHMEILSGLAV